MSFERDGAPVFWLADSATEALVVANVHRSRGYDFLGATDADGRPVAEDVSSLDSLAESERLSR